MQEKAGFTWAVIFGSGMCCGLALSFLVVGWPAFEAGKTTGEFLSKIRAERAAQSEQLREFYENNR